MTPPASLDVVGRPTPRGVGYRAEQLDRDRERLLEQLELEQLRPYIAPAPLDLRRARLLARLLEAGQ